LTVCVCLPNVAENAFHLATAVWLSLQVLGTFLASPENRVILS